MELGCFNVCGGNKFPQIVNVQKQFYQQQNRISGAAALCMMLTAKPLDWVSF